LQCLVELLIGKGVYAVAPLKLLGYWTQQCLGMIINLQRKRHQKLHQS